MSIRKIRNILSEEFLESLYSIYSPATVDEILRGYCNKRKTTLRINSLKAIENEVLSELSDNRVKYQKCSWYNEGFVIKNFDERKISSLDCYRYGKVYLQSLSSMIPPLCLDIEKGMRILDMCSSPGSKTTQIATLLNNNGYILANDIDKVRSERLKHNLSKQGVSCTDVRTGDARELGALFEEVFDRVIVDAPCSGEGIININNTGSYKNWTLDKVFKNSCLQKQLLESGRRTLKKGGILVYSTCTISVEENEEVINWFVNKYRDMKIVSINIPIEKIKLGIKNYRGKSFISSIEKAIRIIPNELMEGFFVCKLIKE